MLRDFVMTVVKPNTTS